MKQVFEGARLGEEFGFWLIGDDGNYLRRTDDAPVLRRAILACALLDRALEHKRQSVHMEKLLETGGVGRIFRLAREDFDSLLVDIGGYYRKQVAWVSHTAGLDSISIMNCPPLAMGGEPGLGKSKCLQILAARLGALDNVTVGVMQRPQSSLGDFYREMGDLFGVAQCFATDLQRSL